MARLADLLDVPAGRAADLETVLRRITDARRVVLLTHVNADGDGGGSQAAVAAWLEESRGISVSIVNPTPFPDNLRFLLHRPDIALDAKGAEGQAALRDADLALVLDTSEPNRIAPLNGLIDPDRTIVIDHHPAGPEVVGTFAIQDPTAAATGELVYDLLILDGANWPAAAVQGVYVALVTDTGSFRFANTTARAHAVAASMLERGIDPEAIFERLYAAFPLRRFHLLREALATLETDPEHGVSWMAVPAEVSRGLQARNEDFEGLIDHARAIAGTRVAILFRGMDDGSTKISFRSNGNADVNRIAREFGGGGHVKAAGASVEEGIESLVPKVLASVRASSGNS
jgi:phosphoesterase RecJ-like protein